MSARVLRLDLMGAVCHVACTTEEIERDLHATYPCRDPDDDPPDVVLDCRTEDAGTVIRMVPDVPPDDLFLRVSNQRFSVREDGLHDATTGTTFQFDGRELVVNGPARPALETVLLHAALWVLRERGVHPLLLHGAAVARPDSGTEAIVLVGPSGVGKSTLTNALCRHGAVYMTDEIVVLDKCGVRPYPRSLSVRDASCPGPTYRSSRGEEKTLVSSDALGDSAAPASSRPVSLLLVEPFGASFVTTPLAVSEAAKAILPHVYNGREEGAGLFMRLAALLRSVHSYRVRPGTPQESARALFALAGWSPNA